jgi:hypothetical protein
MKEENGKKTIDDLYKVIQDQERQIQEQTKSYGS